MIFCDTSALAKYYVPEGESPALASRLDSEDAVVVSELVTALHEGSEEICTFDRQQQAAVRALGLALATV